MGKCTCSPLTRGAAAVFSAPGLVPQLTTAAVSTVREITATLRAGGSAGQATLVTIVEHGVEVLEAVAICYQPLCSVGVCCAACGS